jgi:hypothetical protein
MAKTVSITLTLPQLLAVLDAVSNFTDGCARDTEEMRKSGVTNPRVLVAAEAKLSQALDQLSPSLTSSNSGQKCPISVRDVFVSIPRFWYCRLPQFTPITDILGTHVLPITMSLAFAGRVKKTLSPLSNVVVRRAGRGAHARCRLE